MKKYLVFIFLFSFLFSQKAVLVTGGAGFIGSHLCDRLIERGDRVICLDDFSTGSLNNIVHLLQNKNFRYVKQDLTEPFTLNEKVDEIFHLACPASPVQYQKNAIKTIKTNFFGVLFVLELARKNKAKVFQASTSEIYGDPLSSPQKESDWGNVNPIGIRACYDEGKRIAETLFFDYFRTYKVRIKVGRIFNTYGPRMNVCDGRVVPNFILQALYNNPITLYGKGDQTRSFCYIDDLIDGILAFMDTDDSQTGPVNLGSDKEYTIYQLSQKIIQLTNSSSQTVFTALPEDDPKKRKPDLILAKQLFSWEPKIFLDEGLRKTIYFFKNQK